MKQRMSTRRLALLGMMSAVVFAANYARIVLPVPVGGTPSFTLANIACVLSGLLLGPMGGLAAGLGSALYDLTNPLWAAECWITFLTKGTMGLMAGVALKAGRKGGEAGCFRCLIAAVAGCLSYYALFFLKGLFYNGMLIGGLPFDGALVTLAALVPTSLFNGGIAVAAAPPLAVAVRKALDKGGVKL